MSTRSSTLAAFKGALAAVETERALINDLNVYPVPDGDTGTNLALTVRAIVEEVERSPADDTASLAAAVTKGSLMGARGNSGVILSQIVRGVCDVLGSASRTGAAEVKRALYEASAAAYRAVKDPVEGTMLTVIREMAAAAQAVPDSAAVQNLLAIVEDAGRVAVERTTEQLAVLRKAGVVDAGGYGLLVLLRGLSAVLAGKTPADVAGAAGVALLTPSLGADEASELSKYRYCTSFLVRGAGLSRTALEGFLLPIGDSSLVVGDEEMLKVHVHTDDPGVVLSHAVSLGGLSEVEINDMHAQTRERDARLQERPVTATAVVAVVAGEGNKQLFRELGCAAIVDGGQSMNPSAAQLLEAVETLGGDEVILLPNNGNVILTAEQAAGMSPRHIAVVPSTSMTVGLSAMVAFDPDTDAVGNARAMEAAIVGAHSAEITHSVRDSELDGVVVRQGQVIGLVDGRLVTAGNDLAEAFAAVMRCLAGNDPEVITVLTSINGSAVTVDELEMAARAACPQAEVSFYVGDQPLYPILVGAE
jgi:DAK2 domain fusion protein YloV